MALLLMVSTGTSSAVFILPQRPRHVCTRIVAAASSLVPLRWGGGQRLRKALRHSLRKANEQGVRNKTNSQKHIEHTHTHRDMITTNKRNGPAPLRRCMVRKRKQHCVRLMHGQGCLLHEWTASFSPLLCKVRTLFAPSSRSRRRMGSRRHTEVPSRLIRKVVFCARNSVQPYRHHYQTARA